MPTSTISSRFVGDRIVSILLKMGAYGSFALIVSGILMLAMRWQAGHPTLRLGILVLLATPLLRILVVAYVFWREKDLKYALIATVVLLIVIGSSLLGAFGLL